MCLLLSGKFYVSAASPTPRLPLAPVWRREGAGYGAKKGLRGCFGEGTWGLGDVGSLLCHGGIRTGEIPPRRTLRLAEPCKGARQGPGGCGALMLFPGPGGQDFALNHCCALAEGAQPLCYKRLPVFYTLPWFAHAQTVGLSSVTSPHRLRRQVAAAGSRCLSQRLSRSIPSPGLPGLGRKGPTAWWRVDLGIHGKISGALG